MNKVYKVIYSKVKQCNVVVSEIAKSHGRHTKSSVAKKKAALAAATLTLPGLIAVETMPTAEAKENLHSNDFFGVNYQYTMPIIRSILAQDIKLFPLAMALMLQVQALLPSVLAL